jgi:hypothetical protein
VEKRGEGNMKKMMVKVIGEKAEEGDRRVVGIIERLAST